MASTFFRVRSPQGALPLDQDFTQQSVVRGKVTQFRAVAIDIALSSGLCRPQKPVVGTSGCKLSPACCAQIPAQSGYPERFPSGVT